jgi:hypothetical protein
LGIVVLLSHSLIDGSGADSRHMQLQPAGKKIPSTKKQVQDEYGIADEYPSKLVLSPEAIVESICDPSDERSDYEADHSRKVNKVSFNEIG